MLIRMGLRGLISWGWGVGKANVTLMNCFPVLHNRAAREIFVLFSEDSSRMALIKAFDLENI